MASADRVDLLCSFLKVSGINVLWKALAELRARGVPLRVITTTYMGATDAKSIHMLHDMGAEVKVSYLTTSTRLHAKAWLFERDSGFSTGYVGSSNLSAAAMTDGLEWNVRLPSALTPGVLYRGLGPDARTPLLFVRRTKSSQEISGGTEPYVFLGPVSYVSHEGSQPMHIMWELERAMPAELFNVARVAA